MAPLGQTIAVIDKSGKVVSTSKQLFGVFAQAKAAYKERKSHFNSERNAKIAEQQALRALATYQIDDAPSAAGSRRSHRSRSRHHSSRSQHPRASSRYEQDLHSATGRPESHYGPAEGLPRRHTHHDVTVREPARPATARSKSDAHIDMDLAYGEAHPTALSMYNPPEPAQNDKQQMDGLVSRAQWLLEEAHCVQHSATATISHLQKNPDAMAAVALTLAEISNLASKMGPAALSAFKTAAPTVWALLASPQFLIAAGVGLGVTVVMFGGYKIIKKIQAGGTSEGEKESTGMDEMMEFDVQEMSRVEMWRRGVADMEAVSVGTSVDGEFITPRAAALSGIDVSTARAQKDPRFKFNDDGSVASSRRSRRSRASQATSQPETRRGRSRREPETASKAPSGLFTRSSKPSNKAPSRAPSRAPSKAPSRAPSNAPSRTGTHVSEKEKRPKEKKKKGPSRLRLMFTA
ncbi:hypothetical protein N7462_010575 [Penicillium macrosclerotiorum]|uniref:uncharacterized protein n=1 Tax=Penicillium macrosclerotiorum TaxID=303699 RepID=UPI002547B8AF|nr:uncharacterized protein N7462_010575 [Penicillium macrosclerotiorum]KAJ5669505.1 hypothetical protein N7462_010575 [Penicillium macrosclerotiorum]